MTRELPDVALVNSAIWQNFRIIQIELLKHSYLFLSACMDAPHVYDHFSKGRAKVKNVSHGRPPPLVVVSWKTNIEIVGATVLARRLLSKTKDSYISWKIMFSLRAGASVGARRAVVASCCNGHVCPRSRFQGSTKTYADCVCHSLYWRVVVSNISNGRQRKFCKIVTHVS